MVTDGPAGGWLVQVPRTWALGTQRTKAHSGHHSGVGGALNSSPQSSLVCLAWWAVRAQWDKADAVLGDTPSFPPECDFGWNGSL